MPSSSVKQAGDLYRDFTGHEPVHHDLVDVDWPETGLTVGECEGILYSCVRDGVPERYIHKFKRSARPLLVASYDGAQLALVGGDFRFTDAGITDN